jgi:hypothetical protein
MTPYVVITYKSEYYAIAKWALMRLVTQLDKHGDC